MKSSINLPTRLKELRIKNKYSQGYIAEQLNISRQAISHWENGKSYPDIDNLVLLADLFHITVDELLDDKAECKCDPEDETPEDIEVPDEVETPDEVVVPDEDEVPDKPEVPGKVEDTNSLIEILVLSIVLVLSANVSIIGIPVAIFILIRSFYTKRHYKVVYVLCVMSIMIGIHELFAVYSHFDIFYGNPFVMFR